MKPLLGVLVAGVCSLIPVQAQAFKKLPDWAVAAVVAASSEAPPVDADSWVLLERTEIAYLGEGRIRKRNRRVVRVLTEKGHSEGTYVLRGLGGSTSRIKKLKGWNARPDDELEKLDTQDVIRLDAGFASAQSVTSGFLTSASLSRVVTGSFLAFESLEEIQHPLGPIEEAVVMEPSPVRVWELETSRDGGWFENFKQVAVRLDVLHAEPWATRVRMESPEAVRFLNVAPLPKGESAIPDPRNCLPRISVAFLDPAILERFPWGDWNSLGRWFADRYGLAAGLAWPLGERPDNPKAGLEKLMDWISREFTYRRFYLTPERGWIPEGAGEIARKRYGDCKDLTCLVLGGARGLKLEAYPVLCRIESGEIEASEPVSPFAFNHVIAAIRIPASMGWPAEVESSGARFLLIDPTARGVPLGRLPASHRGRRVLLTTPGGSAWVEIPDSAIQEGGVQVSLEGRFDEEGAFTGSMVIVERGGVLGLRETHLTGGLKELKQRLISVELPDPGSWRIESAGDPLDLDRPFQVRVKIERTLGMAKEGGAWILPSWGFPPLLGPIQKSGASRKLPIFQTPFGPWDFNADVAIPAGHTVHAPKEPIRGAFVRMTAHAKVESQRLKLQIRAEFPATRFDHQRREEGLKTHRKDRSAERSAVEQLRTLLKDPG